MNVLIINYYYYSLSDHFIIIPSLVSFGVSHLTVLLLYYIFNIYPVIVTSFMFVYTYIRL